MRDYFKDLEIFNPSQNDKIIDITVPVIMDMNNTILRLKVLITENQTLFSFLLPRINSLTFYLIFSSAIYMLLCILYHTIS